MTSSEVTVGRVRTHMKWFEDWRVGKGMRARSGRHFTWKWVTVSWLHLDDLRSIGKCPYQEKVIHDWQGPWPGERRHQQRVHLTMFVVSYIVHSSTFIDTLHWGLFDSQ